MRKKERQALVVLRSVDTAKQVSTDEKIFSENVAYKCTVFCADLYTAKIGSYQKFNLAKF